MSRVWNAGLVLKLLKSNLYRNTSTASIFPPQSSSNGVRLGTPNTATVTILSNDNAFGIIAFNSVSPVFPRPSSGRLWAEMDLACDDIQI